MALALDEMSARFVTEEMKMVAEKVPAFIVSADGHVDEPEDNLAQFARLYRPPDRQSRTQQARVLARNCIELYGLDIKL